MLPIAPLLPHPLNNLPAEPDHTPTFLLSTLLNPHFPLPPHPLSSASHHSSDFLNQLFHPFRPMGMLPNLRHERWRRLRVFPEDQIAQVITPSGLEDFFRKIGVEREFQRYALPVEFHDSFAQGNLRSANRRA